MERRHLAPTIRALERAVGTRIEHAVAEGQLTDAFLLATRATRLGTSTVERARSGVVHALNMPTVRDVRRLTATVARLEAEVHELSARLDDTNASSA